MKVVLYGVGGHARSVASLIKLNGIELEGFIHPDATKKDQLLGNIKFLGNEFDGLEHYSVVLGVGNNTIRKDNYKKHNVYKNPIIHPTAFVDECSIIGCSNLFFAFAYIGPEVVMGENNILNTHSTIEHEVVMGCHNHVSIGTLIAGRVTIGDECFIGAGAVIKEKVKIGNNIIIGAGAVVLKDVLDPGVYVGNPLRKIR